MTRALLLLAALVVAPRVTDACSLAPPCAELAPAAKPAASLPKPLTQAITKTMAELDKLP